MSYESLSHMRGTKQQMPNGAATSRTLYPVLSEPFQQEEPQGPAWYVRAGVRIGVMVHQPESPKGWGFNPAVVTLCLVIVSMAVAAVGALMAGAYYVGQRDNEARHIQERIDEVQQQAAKAQADAEKAKQLETYNAGAVDASKSHVVTKKEK